MRKRSAVAIPVLLALAVTAGCTRTANSGAVPADPPPPSGLVLRLEPARAPAGGLVTLRIDGPSAAASTMGVDADFQRWNGSTWRTEYLLDAWGPAPAVRTCSRPASCISSSTSGWSEPNPSA